MYSFTNHIILITGCNGKIGQKLCRNFCSLDARIIGVDIAPKIFNSGESLLIDYFSCDLSSIEERLALIESLQTYPRINVLINNAAYTGESNLSGWTSQFQDQSIEAWNLAIEVNLTAPFHLIQGLLPLLEAASSPKVINVGSIYGSRGPHWNLYENTSMGNPCAYAASKGGLINEQVFSNVVPKINVNTISPGGIFEDSLKVLSMTSKHSFKANGHRGRSCGSLSLSRIRAVKLRYRTGFKSRWRMDCLVIVLIVLVNQPTIF